MALPDDDTTLRDLCPFCGEPTDLLPGPGSPEGGATARCRACLAFLDPLSREVTHSHMGPWFIRDATRPHYPGVSFEVIAGMIARGDVTRESAVRGPGTGQFWMRAALVPGLAHLLGSCHSCGAEASRDDERCPSCGIEFPRFPDRDRLGLDVDERISAFATNEELRAGAPAPSSRPAPTAVSARPRPDVGRARRADGEREGDATLTPLERTLGQEVANERRKAWWLAGIVGGLLLINVALAVLVLLARR